MTVALDKSEHLVNNAWSNAFILMRPVHCKCLASARLPEGEDSHVVPVHGRLDEIPTFVKDLTLSSRFENTIEGKGAIWDSDRHVVHDIDGLLFAR